jgi:hypothetical protein
VTFEDEVAFLEKYGKVILLEARGGGRVALSPKYQGRVMTSVATRGGASLGWINHAFIEAGKTGTGFDNYGGEDRFWLGPEAGQFGLYFKPGTPFTFDEWQTPAAFQEGEWQVAEQTPGQVTFTRPMKLKNYSGADFDLMVTRTVRLLGASDVTSRIGMAPPSSVQWVAFESINKITNTGSAPWTKDHGLLSVWILGMYNSSPDAYVAIPFARGEGELVNDRYFGKVPSDRLSVDESAGVLFFKCDGKHRSKIGVGPARTRPVVGSYSESARLLTIVHFDKPEGAVDYVNSMWETQKNPYGGDVVNSYNDGPPAPDKPPLGGFYEVETSSPAAALAPGQSLVHTHRTFHFVGDRAALDALATKAIGVSAGRMAAGR